MLTTERTEARYFSIFFSPHLIFILRTPWDDQFKVGVGWSRGLPPVNHGQRRTALWLLIAPQLFLILLCHVVHGIRNCYVV